MSARTTRPDAVSAGLAGLLLVVLGAPMVALLVRTSLEDLGHAFARSSVLSALETSLVTTATSLVAIVIAGTPLAWAISQSRHRAAQAVELVVRAPIVLPPSVAGVALLLAFGHEGVFAGWLYPRGSSPAFGLGAVVLAQIFVAAPLYVQAATSAFRRLDPMLVLVARSLGAGRARVLWRVVLPAVRPSLLAGAALAWARAVGEFGATLLFAGNMEGRTQTLPLAIYSAFESDLGVARALSVWLVLLALVVLALVRALESRAEERA
ncbi:MAG: ABC transporter permease [Sandaracinus sp.]